MGGLVMVVIWAGPPILLPRRYMDTQYYLWKRVQSTTDCPLRRCGAVKGQWCDRAEYAGKVHRVRALTAGVTEFDIPSVDERCDYYGPSKYLDRKEDPF